MNVGDQFREIGNRTMGNRERLFNRHNEIEVLRSRVEDGNHVLLTGQRRMGKTSLAQEFGRRLQDDGWAFLFADVEDAQDPQDFIALLILAEAATQQEFDPKARRCLDKLFSPLIDDAPSRISDALDILEHDGYLHNFDGSYRFQSNLLKDWWRSRYDQHHLPICEQLQKD